MSSDNTLWLSCQSYTEWDTQRKERRALSKGHNKQSHYVTTSLGVLKPRPTLRRWRLALPPFSRIALELRKTVGCFWKAFSVCNNNHHAGAKVKVHTHTNTPCLEVKGCQGCCSTIWKEVVRNTATCPQLQPWLSTTNYLVEHLTDLHHDHDGPCIPVETQSWARETESPVESCEWSQHAWVGAGLAYLAGCLEAQPHLTGVPESPRTLPKNLLAVQENKWLFLEGSLTLQPPAGLMSVPPCLPQPWTLNAITSICVINDNLLHGHL